MITEILCAYCGKQNPETQDHIPPKSLFPKPYPNDPITVPCCENCRSNWSKDDEYFRTVLLTAENLYSDFRAFNALSSVYRSVRKPGKVRFAKMISESFRDIEIRTKTGIVLPMKTGFNYDALRISRVLSRIVRALFFHEFTMVLPTNFEIITMLDQYGQKAQEITKTVQFETPRWAYDNMFVYMFAKVQDSKYSGIWLGAFYEKVSFVGFVKPKMIEGSEQDTL